MKKYFVSLLSILTLLIVLALTDQGNYSVSANSTGAPAGYTGSPGDGRNCTECHSGTATSANGLITSNIPVIGYKPDSIYTITASITTAGIVRFGFEVSPQTMAGAVKGTLAVTNSSQTQLVGSGGYITHTFSGTAGSGSKTWTFNWTAPVKGTGDVTFYGAFNSTNDDNTDNGDHITLSQMLVHENITTGVHEPLAETSVKVFPNPASSFINMTPNPGTFINLIEVFDLSGNKIKEEATPDNGMITLDIHSLKAGIYVLMITMNEKIAVEKIVVS